MKQKMQESQLFSRNRKKLLEELTDHSLVVLHSNDFIPRSADQFYPFKQNADFFYLSGIDQERTILTLCPHHSNEDMQVMLFIKRTDEHTTIWEGPKLTREEAREISGIDTIKWIDEFDGIIPNLMSESDHVYMDLNERLNFDSDYISPNRKMIENIQGKYPLHHYHRLAPIIAKLRMVKEPEEIKLVKQACTITEHAFHKVLRSVKPGMMEYEIEAEIIYEFIRNGADGHAFLPIVASGENACILHYINNNQQCKDGDLLLLDFGAEFCNYSADCSRTIPVNGRFNDRQKQLYESVLSVFKRAKKLMLPGSSINEINRKVEMAWEMKHIELGLYTREDVEQQDKDNQLVKKYFPHGNSHFLGLDVHDVGKKSDILKPGMILTCEPGIYIPDEKIGIRLETDILITEDEPIDLLADLPIEIEEIEKLMNQ